MIEAAAFIGFVVLAIVCLALAGPFGIVLWLAAYGLFHALARGLLAHIGDEADCYAPIPRRRPRAL